MKRRLNDRELIRWIKAFLREHSYAPSVREVAEVLGLRLSSAHEVLAALRERGEVEWNEGENRTLRVSQTDEDR